MLHYTRFTIPGTRFCALKSADSCQVSSCCIVWYCVPCHTTQTCATHSVWASFKLQSYHSILGKLPDIKFKIKWNTATAIAALVSLDHLKIPQIPTPDSCTPLAPPQCNKVKTKGN